MSAPTSTEIRPKPEPSQMEIVLEMLKHAIKMGGPAKCVVMCVNGWAEAEAAILKLSSLAYKILMFSANAVVYH